VLDCDIEGLLEAQERFGRPVVEGWRNEFASRAWGRIRDGDWMARSGEYSFMFVLPETDAKGARCVAERLRRLIALHPLVTPVALIDFSLGVGVTAMEAHRDPDCAMRVNALLRKADAASNRCRQLDGTRAGDSLN
jgi:GGDEF domain-containing protein